MKENSRATLEVIAPTVDEAVEKGLSELNLRREDVEVEILDEGSKGLFGFGNRQVRVRLTLKAVSFEAKEQQPETEEPFDSEEEDEEEEQVFDLDDDLDEDQDGEFGLDAHDLENVRSIAQATVTELLEKMDINRAKVESEIIYPEDGSNRPTILVEVLGNDLSILIGKRAETLNALQYITRLIVGKEIGHGVNLTVDVEGYRSRREQNLRQLARRMASQAVKTGRKQMLEPMPANERRIIHIELRDNDEVYTESVGEEPRRKITIIPHR